MTNDIITMHVIVHGRVQGVCFRSTTRECARSLEVSGSVKNLPDGTVEIWAQGAQKTLETFLKRLKEDPGRGEVFYFDITHRPSDSPFKGFQVIY